MKTIYFQWYCFVTARSQTMSSTISYRSLTRLTIFFCFLSTVIQVLGATVDLDDEDDEIFHSQNKPYRRKSARMAFLEESDDPMFKFLTKILNTAQLRTKNRMARAQNGIKQTQELKTEVTNKLGKNLLSIESKD